VVKGAEYTLLINEGHTGGSNDFFMYYFVFTGVHLAHLVIGTVILLLIARMSRRPQVTPGQRKFAECGALHWHMVEALWLVLFRLLIEINRSRAKAMGVTHSGIAELARFFRYMLAFSSDSHIEFTSLIRDGAAFAAEWRWAGTSDGPLQLAGKTYEPTGLRFDVPGVAICRTRDDGLIVCHKDYYDVATLVRQIGLRLG